jgi:hypothetical protein
MAEEISKKALLVLVIIAVVVSVFSTTLVMNAVYQETAFPSGLPGGGASATLTVPPVGGAGASLTVPENPNPTEVD